MSRWNRRCRFAVVAIRGLTGNVAHYEIRHVSAHTGKEPSISPRAGMRFTDLKTAQDIVQKMNDATMYGDDFLETEVVFS